MAEEDNDSILDKIAPPSINQFDAFPKVPSTYQHRSDSRGFVTVLIGLLCFTLILNDIGEFIWGWPEYRFDVDRESSSYMLLNLDMVVAMPCRFLSVDLRDSTGDRLHLSDGFRRDGTVFDPTQANAIQEVSDKLSSEAGSAVPTTRRSRGFLATILRKKRSDFNPTKSLYKHESQDTACRIYGSMVVKKVTANLHVTTLGHGYASNVHVDHTQMNLTHLISELSFGPYFPEIVQPLDNTVAQTHEHFTAFQYFLTIVPTKYKGVRRRMLRTNQYSVTNYVRQLQHGQGTPGIFFKFDLDPVGFQIEEKTTTLVQFLIRCVGVVGGVWCCMGWAVKISYRAYEAVSGQKEGEVEIVAVETTGAKRRWGGGELKKRVVKQGSGWVVEGSNEWGGSPSPYSAGFPHSPSPGSPVFASNIPLPPSAPPTGGYFHSPRPSQSNFGHQQVPQPPAFVSGGSPSGLPTSPLPPRQFSGRSGSGSPVAGAGHRMSRSMSQSSTGGIGGHARNMSASVNGGVMTEEERDLKNR